MNKEELIKECQKEVELMTERLNELTKKGITKGYDLWLGTKVSYETFIKDLEQLDEKECKVFFGGTDSYKCLLCEKRWTVHGYNGYIPSYCPNCGARIKW